MGDTPRRRYLERMDRQRVPLTPGALARALEVDVHRQVRKDGTFDLDGVVHEVSGRHLAGKRIVLVVDALTGRLLRATWQGRTVRFGVCDPIANHRRKRPSKTPETLVPNLPFDPISALLDKARKDTPDE